MTVVALLANRQPPEFVRIIVENAENSACSHFLKPVKFGALIDSFGIAVFDSFHLQNKQAHVPWHIAEFAPLKKKRSGRTKRPEAKG